MENQDWEKLGEDISRTVQEAIDSRNYNRLNQTITNTISGAMDTLEKSLHNVGDVVDKTARNFQYQSRPHGTQWEKKGYRYNRQQEQNMYQGRYQGGEAKRAGTYQQRQGGAFNQGQQTAYSQGSRAGYRSSEQRASQTEVPSALMKRQELFAKPTGAKVGGIIMTVMGFSIGISMLFTLGALVTGILLSPETMPLGISVMVILAVLAGIFTVGGWILAGAGTSLLGKAKRYSRYLGMLGEKEYCEIKYLADNIKKSSKFVTKDIEKMIRKGWFRQGHLDSQRTCLITSNEAYEQYHDLMERMEKQKLEEKLNREQQAKEQEKQAKDQKKLDPQVQEIIRTGDEYIKKIHESNDAIPGEEISAKISRMEVLVDRIFDRVEQNPESISDIRRLMEYYLPTTVKLLEAYEELDSLPVQGENIITSKNEIEKTLDTLNVAFEKLLDSLFQDTAWDVSSDISVLNTMLAQEGLTKDDF